MAIGNSSPTQTAHSKITKNCASIHNETEKEISNDESSITSFSNLNLLNYVLMY